ncbi:hypothetical protein C8R46DRAFT_1295674 [Mycena filopes]|nr:hypothetical protein C8R46DRAFT_1295674 [Mycena filopes]
MNRNWNWMLIIGNVNYELERWTALTKPLHCSWGWSKPRSVRSTHVHEELDGKLYQSELFPSLQLGRKWFDDSVQLLKQCALVWNIHRVGETGQDTSCGMGSVVIGGSTLHKPGDSGASTLAILYQERRDGWAHLGVLVKSVARLPIRGPECREHTLNQAFEGGVKRVLIIKSVRRSWLRVVQTKTYLTEATRYLRPCETMVIHFQEPESERGPFSKPITKGPMSWKAASQGGHEQECAEFNQNSPSCEPITKVSCGNGYHGRMDVLPACLLLRPPPQRPKLRWPEILPQTYLKPSNQVRSVTVPVDKGSQAVAHPPPLSHRAVEPDSIPLWAAAAVLHDLPLPGHGGVTCWQ